MGFTNNTQVVGSVVVENGDINEPAATSPGNWARRAGSILTPQVGANGLIYYALGAGVTPGVGDVFLATPIFNKPIQAGRRYRYTIDFQQFGVVNTINFGLVDVAGLVGIDGIGGVTATGIYTGLYVPGAAIVAAGNMRLRFGFYAIDATPNQNPGIASWKLEEV